MKNQTIIIGLKFVFPIVIIAFLQLYSRLRKGKLTAQAPFLFLQDNDRNRLMTTLAFGFFSQIISSLLNFEASNLNLCRGVFFTEKYTCNFFVTILEGTLTALIAYPLFALISSQHILVSSILGIVYIAWEMVATGLQFNVPPPLILKLSHQIINTGNVLASVLLLRFYFSLPFT